jgi:hypothetical protein
MDKNDPAARLEWCPWCGDTAWVELLGTIRVGHVTYGVGAAPCRGCKLGLRVYEANVRRGRYFENYTEADVDPSALPVSPTARVVGHRIQKPRLALIEPPRTRPEPPIDEIAAGEPLLLEEAPPYDGDEPPPPPGPDDIPF